MRFIKSKQLYSYWLKLKGQRSAPQRGEIEPNDIRGLLGDIFILEINHSAKYVVYRLAGTRLCSAYGRELKGVGYFVHWHEHDNVEIMCAVNSVYKGFVPSVISHHAQTRQQRFMDYETLLLPLQPINDGTTRILGISSPANIAFWHGVEPIVVNKLRSIREFGTGEDGSTNIMSIPTPPPLQPHDPPYLPIKAAGKTRQKNRKIGHLTLLDGGKS